MVAYNLIRLVFLVYAAFIVYVSQKGIRLVMTKKIGEKAVSARLQGIVPSVTFLPLKKAMAPGLFWWNLITVCGVTGLFVLQLLFGWFSVMAWPMRILNSLMLLAAGAQAFLLAVVGNTLRYGEAFFWYRADTDEDSRRPFASSVLDVVLYAVIPLLMIVCNFAAL